MTSDPSTSPSPSPSADAPLTWVAEPTAAKLRLDRWLCERMEGRTRSQIQNDIEEGRVLVDGEAQPARYLIRPGDQIRYDLPRVAATRLQPEAMALTIVFEDEHLMVVNKPAGLVVHPAPGHDGGTLANALLAHCGPTLEGVGGEGRWGIVHRLDSGTSGLLVAAKTQPAYEALVAALADRRIHRQYLGLAIGSFHESSGTIDRPIGRRPSDRKRMGIVHDGRPARTHWRVLLDADGLMLLALTLDTGRTHQIRVHLQSLGHPVLGDSVYGWTRPRTLQELAGQRRAAVARAWPRRPMLHAARLSFEHPIEPGRKMDYLVPPPPDFDPVAKAFWGDTWREKIAFEDAIEKA